MYTLRAWERNKSIQLHYGPTISAIGLTNFSDSFYVSKTCLATRWTFNFLAVDKLNVYPVLFIKSGYIFWMILNQ